MTDTRERKRTAVGRRRGVDWRQLNAIAIVMVGAGLVAVLAMSVRALGGGGDGGADVVLQGPERMTPTAVATLTPSAVAPTATPRQQPTRDEPATVACGDILVPLDKEHRLSPDCVPGDLRDLPAAISRDPQRMRAAASDALGELVAAAKAQGYALTAVSAYRSYDDQVAAYEENRAIYGGEVDRFSARPGHSEHQLGTTVDLSTAGAGFELEPFEGTPEAAWVAGNAARFGFVVSYPEGKEQVTGYAYEPWHIRYVGKDTAAKVRQSGLTLHEYLLARR